jgi:hypothetical protein
MWRWLARLWRERSIFRRRPVFYYYWFREADTEQALAAGFEYVLKQGESGGRQFIYAPWPAESDAECKMYLMRTRWGVPENCSGTLGS